jgi:hypothetical protein
MSHAELADLALRSRRHEQPLTADMPVIVRRCPVGPDPDLLVAEANSTASWQRPRAARPSAPTVREGRPFLISRSKYQHYLASIHRLIWCGRSHRLRLCGRVSPAADGSAACPGSWRRECGRRALAGVRWRTGSGLVRPRWRAARRRLRRGSAIRARGASLRAGGG